MNLMPLILIGFCAVVGALLGSVLVGLAVGLGFIILVNVMPDSWTRGY
jgi:anaerobic C4-dicarboxylate transporter